MEGGIQTIERVTRPPDGFESLIRASLAEDFPAIDGLAKRFASGDNRFDREGEVLFCAWLDGALVGVCGLNVDPYADGDRVGRVRHLYVLPAARRSGIARTLVFRVLHHAHADARFTRVRLRTLRDDARRFYEALGFHATPGEADASHALEPPFLLRRAKPMDAPLAAFVAGRTPAAAEPVVFGGRHALQLRAYLTADAPPPQVLLAARAIVRRGDRVLLVRNPDGLHYLPGGRIEAGETPMEAARREVLEETGWDVEIGRPLGLIHGYYETACPTDAGRVIYPDFLWQVFEASPLRHVPDARLADDYEQGGELRPLAEARAANPSAVQRALLEAALAGVGG